MEVTLVYVHVKPEHVDDFIEATIENAGESVHEPGNVRFDVVQSVEDPTRFVLYEAYESHEDALAHKGTLHYQHWRETVENWMAETRVGARHKGLFPEIRERE